ncbi:hypothetical protein LTR57_019517 [Friedmanniomyces endolithicus]|nr:hypothetical protein LTR57_019517 [Friedmanniomyces endolithicus]KAK0964796.1 hypothetical protein LTS01_018688 [Friedmanniomyces endolithicus]
MLSQNQTGGRCAGALNDDFRMVTLSRGEKLTDGIGSTISKDEFLYRLGARSNGVERDQEETIKRLTAEVQRLRNHYGSHDSATSRVDGGTQSSHSTSVAEPSSLENGSTDPDMVASGIRPEALAQKPAQKPARTRRRVNTAAMIRAKQPDDPHPTSPESRLSIELIDTVHFSRAADAWYRELPVRVGYDSVMDKTFRALVLAAKNIRGTPGITTEMCFRALGVALSAIRTAVSKTNGPASDILMVASAILVGVDIMMSSRMAPHALHLEGVATVVKHNAHTSALSHMGQRIADWMYSELALLACVRGVACGLEDVALRHYLSVEYAIDHHKMRLQACGNRLFVGLPRLAMLLRSIRDKGDGSATTEEVVSSLSLATELLQLYDTNAQNDLLHKVHVRKTQRPEGAAVSKYSFFFDSVELYDDAAVYWQGRLWLLRLWLRIRVIAGARTDRDLEPTVVQMKEEARRLVTNICMCCEFAMPLGPCKRRRVFAHGMITLWGAFHDFGDVLPPTFGGLAIASDWIRYNASRGLLRDDPVTKPDMDAAADLFVGGPLKTVFTEQFRI